MQVLERFTGTSSTYMQVLERFAGTSSIVCRYYLFFTNSFVYYGLTLNSGSLIPGNLHFNIIVRSILLR